MKLYKSTSFDSRLASVSTARAMIEQFARQHLPGRNRTQDLLLICEEVICNIIHHGYSDEPGHCIKLELHHDEHAVMLRFKDDAPPFDPRGQQDAVVGLPVAQAPIGGLGLAMIKGLCDQVSYQRRGKYNILSLTCAIGDADATHD